MYYSSSLSACSWCSVKSLRYWLNQLRAKEMSEWNDYIHKTVNCLLILLLINSLITKIDRVKSIIFIEWNFSALVLIRSYMKVLKNLVNIVNLTHVQRSLLTVVNYLNVKNLLYLSQILNFKNICKCLLESEHTWQSWWSNHDVVYIKQQHDVLVSMNE